MFAWYRDAARCYVYLHDHDEIATGPVVPGRRPLMNCTWFTRGWTLQELLAPMDVRFYGTDWQFLDTKYGAADYVAMTTGISRRYLNDPSSIYTASIAERMSWASRRQTGRSEDVAYSLLGLFDINMPLLYGEGGLKAFKRLQEELIKVSTDQSIFAWTWPKDWKPEKLDWATLLAPSPAAFKYSSQYVPSKTRYDLCHQMFSMTNLGLSISLPILPTLGAQSTSSVTFFGGLNCVRSSRYQESTVLLAIPFFKDGGSFFRLPYPESPIPITAMSAIRPEQLYACRANQMPKSMLTHPLWTSPTLQDREFCFLILTIPDEYGISEPIFYTGHDALSKGSTFNEALGHFTTVLSRGRTAAGGVITVKTRVDKTQSSTQEFFLYLGVTPGKWRRYEPLFYCDIELSNGAGPTDGTLDNWLKTLRKRRKRFPRKTPPTDDQGLGITVSCDEEYRRGRGEGTFIPVYVRLKKGLV